MGVVSDAFDSARDAFAVVADAASLAGKPQEVVDGEKFYRDALEEQKPFHKVWFTNIAMYSGLQWAEWDEQIGFLRTPRRDHWRVRLVVNLILPIVRTWMAKILRANISFTGVPETTDEEAQASARVAARLLEAKYYEDDFRRLLKRCVMWAAQTGSGFLWSVYDPQAGKQMDMSERDAAGNIIGEPRYVPIGENVFDVTGPFETLMEPGASEDFGQHRRIMRLRLMKVADIKDKWGITVQSERFNEQTSYWLKVRSLVDAAGRGRLADTRAGLENMAMVKEFFELESAAYPQGRHFVYANGTVIQPTEACDYFLGDERALPAAKFDDLTIPGRAQGMSTIEQLTPIQVAFNRLNSAIIEDVNRLGKPKVLSPKGALNSRQWTDEHGEVVEFVPIGAHEPKIIQGAQINESHFQMRDSLKAYMQEVAGINDASLGRLPRRATSGVAIDLLAEADDTRVAPTTGDMASVVERIGAIALATMKSRYTEQRIVQYVGRNHQADTLTFKGQDLNGCKVVRVAMTPALSRGEKVKIGMELAQNNAIPLNKALEVMELGDLNIIFDNKADQVNYAAMENLGMAKGIGHEPGEFEDHKAHIDTHMRFLNSPAGQALPEPIRQLIIAHIRQHFLLDGQNALPGQRGPAGLPPAPPPAPGGPGAFGMPLGAPGPGMDTGGALQ